MAVKRVYLTQGALNSEGLGFNAQSLRFDNPTNGYLVLEGKFILPPKSFGGLINLIPASSSPSISISTTDPDGNVLTNNGQYATITYYEQLLPPQTPAINQVSVSSIINVSSQLAQTQAETQAGGFVNVGYKGGDLVMPVAIQAPSFGSAYKQPVASSDGDLVTIGTTTDTSAATTLVGLLKALKALLAGGLPAALSGAGNLKVVINEAIAAGTNVIGHIIVDSGVITSVTAITNALPAGTNTIGSVQPIDVALTDRSLSLTTGGTAQQLAAANGTRKYLLIKNPDTETEDLAFSLTGTASLTGQATGSYRLQPGEAFVFENNIVSNQAVSVIAATTGHKITASEA